MYLCIWNLICLLLQDQWRVPHGVGEDLFPQSSLPQTCIILFPSPCFCPAIAHPVISHFFPMRLWGFFCLFLFVLYTVDSFYLAIYVTFLLFLFYFYFFFSFLLWFLPLPAYNYPSQWEPCTHTALKRSMRKFLKDHFSWCYKKHLLSMKAFLPAPQVLKRIDGSTTALTLQLPELLRSA